MVNKVLSVKCLRQSTIGITIVITRSQYYLDSINPICYGTQLVVQQIHDKSKWWSLSLRSGTRRNRRKEHRKISRNVRNSAKKIREYVKRQSGGYVDVRMDELFYKQSECLSNTVNLSNIVAYIKSVYTITLYLKDTLLNYLLPYVRLNYTEKSFIPRCLFKFLRCILYSLLHCVVGILCFFIL